MQPTRNDLLSLIYNCLRELNEQLPAATQFRLAPDTVLIGENGGLDSLGVVNFVTLLEEKLEVLYDRRVTLPASAPSTSENDPWRTVGALADYLAALAHKQ